MAGRFWATTLILAGILASDPARAETERVYSFTFGAGQNSCAMYLRGPNRAEADSWIAGFWSGMNLGRSSYSTGATTDFYAIVAEIEKICGQHLSMNLQEATSMHYMAVYDSELRAKKVK